MREEYDIEVIRNYCEKNKVRWEFNEETDVYTAEIGGTTVSVCDGGRNLIFVVLREEGLPPRCITEPMLMIRPNSPANKVRSFIRNHFLHNKPPDRREKMSRDMQFILQHAHTNRAKGTEGDWGFLKT